MCLLLLKLDTEQFVCFPGLQNKVQCVNSLGNLQLPNCKIQLSPPPSFHSHLWAWERDTLREDTFLGAGEPELSVLFL